MFRTAGSFHKAAMSDAQAAMILSVVLVSLSPGPVTVLNGFWLRVVGDKGRSDPLRVGCGEPMDG